MRSISKFAVLLASLFLAECAMATTYYIAANGSDANSGTSKSSPWLHAPGMQGCSGTCAATTPRAGDQFILRGGDVWNPSANGTYWNLSPWNGSSSSYIQVGGLDQTWYAGNSWTRPIINGRGTFAGTMVNGGGYMEIAFLELTGLNNPDGNSNGYQYINAAQSGPERIHDNYIHGWSHAVGVHDGLTAINCNGVQAFNNPVYNNVVDGSDTSKDSLVALYAGGMNCGTVYQNYFAWVQSGLNAYWYTLHDNTFYMTSVQPYSGSGAHNNAAENNGDPSYSMTYNNVFVGMPTGGGIGLDIMPNKGQSVPSYSFNNVVADGMAAANTNVCGWVGAGNCIYLHNTIECGPDPNGWGGGNPNQACTVVYSGTGGNWASFVNNHFISTGGVNISCQHGSCSITSTPNPNLASQPDSGGYSLTQKYVFSPTASNSITVGASSNDSSYCSAISSHDASAGAACMKDTTYGVAYDTATHTVSFPARTPVPRPASGNWDAGAYQYSSGSATAPNPPTGLSAIVQ